VSFPQKTSFLLDSIISPWPGSLATTSQKSICCNYRSGQVPSAPNRVSLHSELVTKLPRQRLPQNNSPQTVQHHVSTLSTPSAARRTFVQSSFLAAAQQRLASCTGEGSVYDFCAGFAPEPAGSQGPRPPPFHLLSAHFPGCNSGIPGTSNP
jgi:hypothetical protein